MYIDAVGALTAVGLNVPQTMGSLRARIEFFEDLTYFGQDGEPVVGAPTRVAEGVLGLDRLVAMASVALREAAVGAAPGPVPAVVCLAEPEEQEIPEAAFWNGLARESGIEIDRRYSHLIRTGKAGLAAALGRARAVLAQPGIETCFVGGVDSLLHRPRLEALRGQRRLKHAGNPDGVIPGEGAAFVRLGTRRRPDSFASVSGLGVAEEPLSLRSGRPNTAVAWTHATRAALREAGVKADALAMLATDQSTERYGMQEGALAMTRLRIGGPRGIETWVPGMSVGEMGAGAGVLGLAYLAFRHRAGAIPGATSLWMGASDGPARGAVVVSEVARHG